MLDRMADHGTRVRRAIDLHGQDAVESFLDSALVLDNLLDPFLPLREHMKVRAAAGREVAVATGATFEAVRERALSSTSGKPPTFDVLGFLAERAPIAEWQRELLRIVRAEAYYFLPQRMTKIMNEGWASFWHSPHPDRRRAGRVRGRRLRRLPQRRDRVVARQLESLQARHRDVPHGRGARPRPVPPAPRAQRRLVRRRDRGRRLRQPKRPLPVRQERPHGRTEVVDRDARAVKERLLQDLSWGGLPQIELVDDDHAGRGELVLRHHHDGRDLQLAHAAETLKSLSKLWGASVHLETREEAAVRWISSDGARSARASGRTSARAERGRSENRRAAGSQGPQRTPTALVQVERNARTEARGVAVAGLVEAHVAGRDAAALRDARVTEIRAMSLGAASSRVFRSSDRTRSSCSAGRGTGGPGGSAGRSSVSSQLRDANCSWNCARKRGGWLRNPRLSCRKRRHESSIDRDRCRQRPTLLHFLVRWRGPLILP
jgi:stage V sporulation protein R